LAIVLLGYSPAAAPVDIAIALRDPRVYPQLTAAQMAQVLHSAGVFPNIDAAAMTAALLGSSYDAATVADVVRTMFPAVGYAIRTNGQNQFVAIGGIPYTPQLTVECRMRSPQFHPGNWQDGLISKHGDACGWELRVGESVARMMVTVGGVHYIAQPPVTPQTQFQQNRWYHVAGTYDGNLVTVYVDGTIVGQTQISGPITDFTGMNVMLGRNANPNWDSRFFQGDFTEVRIWGRARSQAEIVANKDGSLPAPQPGLLGWWPMTEGGGTSLIDHSGNGHNGDINATWTRV